MSETEFSARILGGVRDVDAAVWDALAGDGNPFMSHAFLTAMEDSGSVGPGTGWQSAPIVIEGDGGIPLAAMPAYLKGHSQGEYVFDHSWADAFQRAGGSYYPKLQIAAPFTPASGPRLLLADEGLGVPLLRAAEQLCAQNSLSSAHATFIDPTQLPFFEEAGWLLRSDLQFHWENRGYTCFDDFLAQLASRKRRALRKERAKAQAHVDIRHISGADLTENHWDAFWVFYQDTGARKWGTPYLTREAFSLLGQRMADRLLLIMAYRDDEPVAGALNVIGGDALYGRYWGCNENIPFLHFELCYYQAIDAAIARGLARVEAGAQGGHKLARGYEPAKTWSAHWIADPGFREAVADFLEREREGVSVDQVYLDKRTPFRRGSQEAS
ncbi:GNAT family N-acetyltransferase [Parerythrobacter jejuensis]|uniref:GNAT family N-acetyltransferase n=1 Tax=Parerythrobacter jejuensis TaxID=795812 RepID=A0A845AXL2_9SPHN|nr:GNAT family N-acetyltransferase [Parerythrobacter jejuensis]MXP30741.1 GNAT family N-acetyltransferase [Parerythrobacter jejuensis]MXP33501.1 GNAT family N-acetyltransferase [Parerythrobacter jejuensis]